MAKRKHSIDFKVMIIELLKLGRSTKEGSTRKVVECCKILDFCKKQ